MHAPYVTEIEIPKPTHLGAGPWHLNRLATVTTLFGKNGSGKSLLLRSWRDIDPDSHHYVVPERTGDMNYNPGYIEQQLDGQHRRGVSKSNYVEQYRRQIIARIHSYFAVRGNTRAEQLPGKPEELEAFLSRLLPDFTLELRAANPPYDLTRVSDNSKVAGIEQISSGEAQLICVGLDILTIAAIWDIQDAQKRVILIDEPDAHIHPDLQVRFADFLIEVSTRYKLQAVVATHSTTLLAAIGQFGGNSASVIYLDRINTSFAAQPFSAMMRELAACLGGHALMGPLFSVPLLLVEGDDDYRIWSQVPRHHLTSFAVIPSHGEEIKKYQKTLEQLFSVIREEHETPSGYALLDGDKPKPEDNEGTPQKHVRFIQLQCRESENLYLTDEVLALLNTTWADAVTKIVTDAGKFGNKAEMLGRAGDWDRKNEDIKTVIQEISQILDTKNVHWTVRIAAVLGRAFPAGQIGEFLGEEVASVLWPSADGGTSEAT